MACASAGSLEVRVSGLEGLVAALRAEITKKDGFIVYQQDQFDELGRRLEEAHRAAKRQSAPFSKGGPKGKAKRGGRKSGEAHGRHGHRRVPDREPDRELDAPLPDACPDCGGRICHDRDVDQCQLDVPEMIRPTLTRFKLGVGHCEDCGRRVQGRHVEQTSDAIGAAASQLGPNLKGWGMWLHYGLGLSFGKVTWMFAHFGVNVTAGAICRASAHAACSDLVPVHAELVKVANKSATITMDESGVRHEVARIEWLHRSEGLLMVV